MPILRVACAADAAYLPHAATLLRSVLVHSGGHDVEAHLLHPPGLSGGARRRLGWMVRRLGGRVVFHAVPDEWVAHLPALPRIPRTMWYRVLLPALLPDADRVLYLDADAVAADSLSPLWETELGDALVGAVTNVLEHEREGHPADLGLKEGQRYFNSGVLLVDLEGWRREGIGGALEHYAARAGPGLLWPDQDALNVVLGGRRLALHPRWNTMNSFALYPWAAETLGAAALAEALGRPGIRHFEGPGMAKPWDPAFTWPGRELYLHHRRRTPWPLLRLRA